MLVFIFETISFIIKENTIWQDSNEGFKYIINVKSTNIYTYIYIYCKDQFWLEPKTGMGTGPKSPNNEFVESGRKN